MKNLLPLLTLFLAFYFCLSPTLLAQNVGIGNTDPQAKLHVTGTGKFTGQLDMTNQDIVNVREIQVTAAGGKLNMDGKNIENVNNLTIQNGGQLSGQTGSTVNFSQSTVTLPSLSTLTTNGLTVNNSLQVGSSAIVNFGSVTGSNISWPSGMSMSGMTGLSSTGTISALTLSGTNLSVTNCGSCSSDARFKKEIQPLQSSLEKLMRVEGVTYLFDQENFPEKGFSSDLQIGFIAQDLAEIFPELVTTLDDGYLSVYYSKMAPILVEAVKEQQAIIEAQRNELDAMKAEMQAVSSAYGSLVERLERLENSASTEAPQKQVGE